MAILLLLLALLGLGVATSAPGPSESDSARLRPPVLELVSDAGTQRAVQGSYCVTGPESGECADFAILLVPERASVVRPGEVVTIAVVGAHAVDGTASVHRRGCERELLSVELRPETRWTVELEPGAYELRLFTTFEAGSTTGDTRGVLGLVVDATAPLEVRPAGGRVACETR
jgi:hypothetical protein